VLTPFLIALAKARFSFLANPQRPGSRPIVSTQSPSVTTETSSDESSKPDSIDSEDQSESQQQTSSQSTMGALSSQDTTPLPASKNANSSLEKSKIFFPKPAGHS
jgi:hypothetical protein